MIKNPILTGFHPDPSIVRVADDYYIAVSSFEWFPGVPIYHSKDLVNWELKTYALTRTSQLNMIGNLNSGGVWAPCLTYDDGLFYLIFTDVKSRKGAFKDTHNYLVTAEKIEGPWSEPIYLNSSGFDPSMFHDDDGKKYVVNMIWDHRKGKNPFGGIVLQEYSSEKKKLVGDIYRIFEGTNLGKTEAPHLYKKNGYYYLITAEGGTEYNHAVTMARAHFIMGPYEVDPTNPILTSDYTNRSMLQKAGHGSLVETPDGSWYMAHLCGRPVVQDKCILGRETALQKCYWTEDGWLRIEGGPYPKMDVPTPHVPTPVQYQKQQRDDFDTEELALYWNALRRSFEEKWYTLSERKGFLRLYGQESMNSLHRQSMLMRRLEHMYVNVETVMEFHPTTFQQMAGLALYYDTEDYVYIRMTYDEQLGSCIGLVEMKYGKYDELLAEDIAIDSQKPIYLRAEIRRHMTQFYFKQQEKEWIKIGEEIDIGHLSDDDSDYVRFTGAFVGLAVQDLSGQQNYADFDYFLYESETIE